MLGQSFVAKHIGGKQKSWVEQIQHRVAATASALGSMKAVKMMGQRAMIHKFDTLADPPFRLVGRPCKEHTKQESCRACPLSCMAEFYHHIERNM